VKYTIANEGIPNSKIRISREYFLPIISVSPFSRKIKNVGIK